MTSNKECFVICPIGEDDSETRKRSDKVMKYVFEPVLSLMGYKLIRADLMSVGGIISTQIINKIIKSPLVIADLTDANPNVFYELALRHASRKPYVQIIDSHQKIPFDVSAVRTVPLDISDLDSVERAKQEITEQIRAIENGHETDSPVSLAINTDLLAHDSNALPVFLEKFWNIEDNVDKILNILERRIIDQIDDRISSAVSDVVEREADRIISEVVHECSNE